MLFHSYVFILVFLPTTFALYFYLQYLKLPVAARSLLLCASLFFYSWWNILYLPLILFSILCNYKVGTVLLNEVHSERARKNVLGAGIAVNIGLLGFFKYADFFISNVNLVMRTDFDLLHLMLPLAISFFTFQQIAYLVDSYKKKVKDNSFLNYALFVTFFPQLIAGPIVHHKQMMPQFGAGKNNTINYENIAKGLFIFAIGLFKKIMIADAFAFWANLGFDNPYELNLLEAWVASLSFGFQLYFDFSGYADMAIGIALMFNIKLPVNFRSPYKATSIQEFWQRWHITLSNFLRDYISLPLKRRGVSLRLNIFLTFMVSGIWHGAGWTFVIWGALHGAALVIQDIWKGLGFKLGVILAWPLTFIFLTVTRVFFRANDFDDAIHMLHKMFFGQVVLPSSLQNPLGFLSQYGVTFGRYLGNLRTTNGAINALIIGFIIILLFKNSTEMMEEMKPGKKSMLFTAFLFTVALTNLAKEQEFYYFIF
mgnify:CR=1 FL=1